MMNLDFNSSKKIFYILIFLLNSWVFNASALQGQSGVNSSDGLFFGSAPENNKKYTNYYSIIEKFYEKNNSSKVISKGFTSPTQFAREIIGGLNISLTAQMNLLYWQSAGKSLPVPSEPYDRKKHFGTWIVDGRSGNCINTRGWVLIRDSKVKVKMDPTNNCVVSSGSWLDPYSNQNYTLTSQLQIDHMVPLKHAYISGAWQWDANTKCLYANYMGYEGHLVSASSVENQAKSDATPYSYMPPNKAYSCQYLANWLKIKAIWRLAIIPPESMAIAKLVKAYGCSAEMFEYSLADLARQRKYMQDNYRLCENNISNYVVKR